MSQTEIGVIGLVLFLLLSREVVMIFRRVKKTTVSEDETKNLAHQNFLHGEFQEQE